MHQKIAGRIDESEAVLLQDGDLEIIKIDGLDEIVLFEPGLPVTLKFADVGIKPGRDGEIKPVADFGQAVHDLVGAGFAASVFDDGVFQRFIASDDFPP
jgi:hypothetical protein